MEHETNTAPNGSHAAVDAANLEAYGDWVTVDSGPRPAPAEADLAAPATHPEVAYQETDGRTAPELTEAEEELLDQLSESERLAAAAPAAPADGPAGGDSGGGANATNATLASLEQKLSSLSAELKVVGRQLAELRGRTEDAPAPAAAAAPGPEQVTDGGAGEEPPLITLEALEREAGPAAETAAAGASAPAAPAAEGPQVVVEPPAPSEPPVAAAPVEPVEPPPAADAPVTVAPAAAAPAAPPVTAAPVAVEVEPLAAEPQSVPAAVAAAPPVTVAPFSVEPSAAPVPAAEEAPAAGGPAPEPQAAGQTPPAPAAEPGVEVSDLVREDVRAVLAYLDQLLDALPPEKVKEFAQSEHFATYKKLFREFGLND